MSAKKWDKPIYNHYNIDHLCVHLIVSIATIPYVH